VIPLATLPLVNQITLDKIMTQAILSSQRDKLASHNRAITEPIWEPLPVLGGESPLAGYKFLQMMDPNRIVPMPSGQAKVPAIVTEPVGNFYKSGEAVDSITSGDPVYSSSSLEHKNLGAIVPISNDALKYAANFEPLVESDMRKALGKVLDSAFLLGSTAEGPSGILVAGNKLGNFTNWADDAEALVLAAINAGLDVSTGVFFARPDIILAGAASTAVTQDDAPLQCLGFPVVPIPYLRDLPAVPTESALAFVVMDTVVVGIGEMRVSLDEKGVGFQQDFSQLRYIIQADAKLRHAKGANWVSVPVVNP